MLKLCMNALLLLTQKNYEFSAEKHSGRFSVEANAFTMRLRPIGAPAKQFQKFETNFWNEAGSGSAESGMLQQHRPVNEERVFAAGENSVATRMQCGRGMAWPIGTRAAGCS